MRAFVLASAILFGASSSVAMAADAPRLIVPKSPPEVLSPFPAKCSSLAGHIARPAEPLKPRKLTDLPPAEAYHTGLRSGGPDGCPDPLMVGYQYRSER